MLPGNPLPWTCKRFSNKNNIGDISMQCLLVDFSGNSPNEKNNSVELHHSKIYICHISLNKLSKHEINIRKSNQVNPLRLGSMQPDWTIHRQLYYIATAHASKIVYVLNNHQRKQKLTITLITEHHLINLIFWLQLLSVWPQPKQGHYSSVQCNLLKHQSNKIASNNYNISSHLD